jgi:hypothetical protein
MVKFKIRKKISVRKLKCKTGNGAELAQYAFKNYWEIQLCTKITYNVYIDKLPDNHLGLPTLELTAASLLPDRCLVNSRQPVALQLHAEHSCQSIA